jgi:chromosome segregation ATPase
MADLNHAVENVRSLARTFQSVIDLADALEGFASVEQAVREANIQLAGKRKQADAAIDELARATAGIDEAHAHARQIVIDAELGATQACDAANAQVEQLLGEARTEADRLLADAAKVSKDAKAAEEAAHARVVKAQNEIADLETRINAAKARMAKMLNA